MNAHIRESLRRLEHDERGLTTVEYVIVLCLIAGLAVGTWGEFGQNVKDHLSKTMGDIENAMTPK
jgi:Flp pilus assembly pilin Flp